MSKNVITQSRAWHKLQQDLGEESVFVEEKDYHYVAIIKHTPVGNYLYCPYGPVFKDQNSFDDALKSLKNLASTHQAFFIRIEPRNTSIKLPQNAKKSHDLNPKETWILNLTGSDEDLRAKLPSRLLRYYKGMAKKGITIEKSHNPDDIHYLLNLQKALANQKGISTFSENYLKTELKQPFATLYLAKHRRVTPPKGDPQNVCDSKILGEEKAAGPVEDTVVAAGLVFDDKDTRYNLQGAQSDEGRKLHATGILTIQLVLDAKEKGLKTFDFWGIAPEDAPDDHPWAGFTNFKKTFAGCEQDYHGTHDLVLNKPKYQLYQLFRALNRKIRK